MFVIILPDWLTLLYSGYGTILTSCQRNITVQSIGPNQYLTQKLISQTTISQICPPLPPVLLLWSLVQNCPVGHSPVISFPQARAWLLQRCISVSSAYIKP